MATQENVLYIHRKVNISDEENVLYTDYKVNNVRYVDYKVNISEEQKEKFFSAIDNNEGVKIRFSYEDLCVGDNLISFTMPQFKKIAKAFDKGWGVTIDMSKDQVQQHEIIEEDDDIVL